MSNDKATEVSKWMSVVANKYNKSIVTVISKFNEALKEIEDIELAKISVVRALSQNK